MARTFLGLIVACLLVGCAGTREVKEPNSEATPVVTPPAPAPKPLTNYYEIGTPLGTMVVELSNSTPLHRDNFRKLADEGYFDSTTFHRVIERFMIQGGDPNSRNEDPSDDGNGGPGYTIPAEITPLLFHRKGALAAAREGDDVNPERRSSGSQFYIVQGQVFDDAILDQIEQRVQQGTRDSTFHFSPELRAVYKTEGGAPHLDGQYTVFGQLVSGFDVLDRIAAAETLRKTTGSRNPMTADRPLTAIPMTVRPLYDYQPNSQPTP